jgi:hypothetical protein
MPIKFFRSGQAGAPQLKGQNGALIAVLDAVLVNGYNTVAVSSITLSGTTATVTTAAAHGFSSEYGGAGNSVVISGADQSEYNIEAPVTVIDGTHFSYAITVTPASPATGTITMKRAPAGFTKEFFGTNSAAYRSTRVDGTRPYLQIIDDGTTYKSATIDATERPWVLITDGKTIYFQASMSTSPDGMQASGGYLWWMGFGDIRSMRASDSYSGFLAACHAANQQQGSSGGACHNGMSAPAVRTASPTSPSCYIVRSYSQVIGAAIMNQMGHGWDQQSIGSAVMVQYPNPLDNGFYLTPLMCMQGGVIRGRMPGVFEPLHGRCLDQFDIVENVEGYPGRKFMALWCYALSGSAATGMLMFDITGNEYGEWD